MKFDGFRPKVLVWGPRTGRRSDRPPTRCSDVVWLRPLEHDRCGWPRTSLTLGEAYVEQLLYEETHFTDTRLESNLIEYIKHTHTHTSA